MTTSIYVVRNFVKPLRMILIIRIKFRLLIRRKIKVFSDGVTPDLKT
jgi:hypothetical protein